MRHFGGLCSSPHGQPGSQDLDPDQDLPHQTQWTRPVSPQSVPHTCSLSFSYVVVVCSRAALVLTMSSKRSAPSTPESSEKKRRKVLILAEKMDVIGMVNSGQGWTVTGKKFGLHEATKK